MQWSPGDVLCSLCQCLGAAQPRALPCSWQGQLMLLAPTPWGGAAGQSPHNPQRSGMNWLSAVLSFSRSIEIVVGHKSREHMAGRRTQAHISALGWKMRLFVLCCTGPFCWFTVLWNFGVNFLLKQGKSVYLWLSCLNSCLLLIRCYSENFMKTLHSDVTIGSKRWACIFLILIVALKAVPKNARFLCVFFLCWISLTAIPPLMVMHFFWWFFFLFLQLDLIFKHAVQSNPVPPSDFWAPAQSPHLLLL